jgi:hypothetical protein
MLFGSSHGEPATVFELGDRCGLNRSPTWRIPGDARGGCAAEIGARVVARAA